MKPKVSIIVPIYNTAQYLPQCLDSLINQTLMDIEIICVDDGSTDESPQILAQYVRRDSRVKILNQKNKGQSAARNAGIYISQGEYIAFLDSDDYAKPNMLEKLYDNAKQYNSDVVMCSITVFDEITQETTDNDPYLSINIFNKKYEDRVFSHNDCSNFLFRICVTPWNKIYKNTFLKTNKIKFAQGVNFEDNPFCLEILLKANKMTIVKEALVIYRRASNTSYTFGKNDYKKLDFFKIATLEENILKEQRLYTKYKDYFKFHTKNMLCYWYKKIKNPIVKAVYLCKLTTRYPFFLLEGIQEKYLKYVIFNKLQKILKHKKIVIWGASQYVIPIIKRLNSKNLLGFVDINPCLHGKKFENYNVYSINVLNELKPDIIIAISKNYYHFEKLIQDVLSENNINIPVLSFSTYFK